MSVCRHRCSICGRRTRNVTLVGVGPSETLGNGSIVWVCDQHADLDDHQAAASVFIMHRDIEKWAERGYRFH